MKREVTLTHEFVEFIPDVLKDRTIYVSIKFATVVHKCFCGCGNEVVTPLSPTGWRLTFDGVSISLDPSIGNWSFDCKSHYWIRSNRVRWAARWSQGEIDAIRFRQRSAKEGYFDTADNAAGGATGGDSGSCGGGKERRGVWRKLKKWWAHPKK